MQPFPKIRSFRGGCAVDPVKHAVVIASGAKVEKHPRGLVRIVGAKHAGRHLSFNEIGQRRVIDGRRFSACPL
jgi:hypothetical protein